MFSSKLKGRVVTAFSEHKFLSCENQGKLTPFSSLDEFELQAILRKQLKYSPIFKYLNLVLRCPELFLSSLLVLKWSLMLPIDLGT